MDCVSDRGLDFDLGSDVNASPGVSFFRIEVEVPNLVSVPSHYTVTIRIERAKMTSSNGIALGRQDLRLGFPILNLRHLIASCQLALKMLQDANDIARRGQALRLGLPILFLCQPTAPQQLELKA